MRRWNFNTLLLIARVTAAVTDTLTFSRISIVIAVTQLRVDKIQLKMLYLCIL